MQTIFDFCTPRADVLEKLRKMALAWELPPPKQLGLL